MAELNVRQERFLKSMMQASSIEEACQVANIEKQTGLKYLSDPIFVAEYQKLRKDRMMQFSGQLQMRSEEAVQVLTEVMSDKSATSEIRVQSARTLVEMAQKINAVSEILEEIRGELYD